MNSIICERRVYSDKNKIHAHSYGQLILPIKGNLNIETSEKSLSLGDEHIFFLPPNCEHLFNANKINEFLVLDIPKNYLKNNDMDKIIGGKEIIFDDKWNAIRHLFLSEINNKSSSSINNLFLYCYELMMSENTFSSVKYIDEHYSEDIDLKKLAEIEHYNSNYYIEWFKNNMGISPGEYIKKLRINKSKELLLNTDLTILQIGESVGYKYNSSFTRAFKDIENITPKEFRLHSK
ncbi:AraC family transcriptional regulator [[Clostridium] sordellii]|uniref:AraC family transcriptional regulator n=1 Tax=Paraclostridium sordellii TaxID=1505 RepID=A0A0C7RQL8_PARSO|nr:AraC family transcriptional regulator [Paeniclostridium sordellii]CEN78394.1 AraC family transcriptional regulator [[Clostridium] sordellii] [Paeniclostridium sordellii]CEO05498.1 AraC family transcriptional regulator [[Clostridium] sordellii] [Paeniclostridium sordellii]CEQ03484.1 AraC family transcriptional regulator [[Clostridium] sordellii] [Paeniclostridium sordellii]CEQ11348.1 AraC family transcriptional regulator [[Clostridium] sordellii] [Paeniclostridium sordellii]CEQ16456.1 AraC f